jgi:hypothetical protein
MGGYDDELTWIRTQVDDIFHARFAIRVADKIPIVAALAGTLAFLSLLITLALTARL